MASSNSQEDASKADRTPSRCSTQAQSARGRLDYSRIARNWPLKAAFSRALSTKTSKCKFIGTTVRTVAYLELERDKLHYEVFPRARSWLWPQSALDPLF